MRICFFGSPDFASFSLLKMAEAGYQVVCVVTAPDKPSGRGMKMHETDVKRVARELGLPVLQPVNLKDPAFIEELRSYKPDLGVVIAFRMLPLSVWSLPEMGTFNLHASLLPQYRGAAPINHAIINGEVESGLSTFFLKHEIDTGDLLLQVPVPIGDDDDFGSLYEKMKLWGAGLVLKTLELIDLGAWEGKPQHSDVPLKPAPKLSHEFAQLQPSLSAKAARDKIRGLSPRPGAWIDSVLGQVKVYKAALSDLPAGGTDLQIIERRLYWAAADHMLEILELQLPGKPRIRALDFVNGQANKNPAGK
jgi:methionyl-tRNA formyltransferase